MKLRIIIFLALAQFAYATETSEKENTDAVQAKDKRQAQEETYGHFIYRTAKNHDAVNQQTSNDWAKNRTSIQPISEDESGNVQRPTREKPDDAEPSKQENKIDQPDGSGMSNAQPIPQPPQVDIQHNGLNGQPQYPIPPPRDGKSYTPEEFTALIVSGYAITPVPDYGFNVPNHGLFGSLSSTARPPFQFTSSPFPSSPFTPNPYFSRNSPISSTLAPALLGLKDQAKIDPQSFNLQQLKDQRSLPPPKNSKAYTVEEFNGLIAAGYPVTPVPVGPLSLDISQSRPGNPEEYRPGQVFSLNARKLLELEPERKAPSPSSLALQQAYTNPQEHKQNLQQIYSVDPQSQSGRQIPPSHAVIARPYYSFNGGEASVGAALSVSDSSANPEDNFDHELLALLGQAQIRPKEPRPTQVTSPVQSVASRYQQIDRYVAKPSKKSSKIRSKVQVSPPQPSGAPQQYLIETTNVQQQQQQQPQQQQPQQQQYQQQQQQSQYSPTIQPQRLAQSLRYIPISQPAQSQDSALYERPESQGLKIVPAPKLQQQQPRAQFSYRLAPQYQQQDAGLKQYRIVELPRGQQIRAEPRAPASSVEKPLAFLKRYPEIEKQRSVKIYDPVESNQQVPLFGDQFILRPIYRSNDRDQRPRYEAVKAEREQPRVAESTKAPHSAIYVSKNLPTPRQQKVRPQSSLREQTFKIDQPSNLEYVNIEQHGQNLDEQRSHLPPPKNNKAYTPEEFEALVAAGYSVTPVPVSSLNLEVAQSRSSLETVTPQPKRRPTQRRRNQYLPVRDDAP